MKVDLSVPSVAFASGSIAIMLAGCSAGREALPSGTAQKLSSTARFRGIDAYGARRGVHPDYSVVYAFPSSGNAQHPAGVLAVGSTGTVFGTTLGGNGTVFKYSSAGLQTIHSFTTRDQPSTGVAEAFSSNETTHRA